MAGFAWLARPGWLGLRPGWLGLRPGWLTGPGPKAGPAGPQVWLAGRQAWLARPHAWLDGPETGVTAKRADIRTNGQKYYRTLSPIGAAAQKHPGKNHF